MTDAAELPELFRALIHDESAAALVEYGLILMLIAGVCLGVLTAIGNGLQGIWTKLAATIHPPS
ncbi:MAG TPA: Flp family type IVb pilin [Candidatus Elarobacter sp.]|jgi:pilus assembly protein Flp/PilA